MQHHLKVNREGCVSRGLGILAGKIWREFLARKIWREFLAGKLQFLLAKSTENLLQYKRASLEGKF
jgi:hypothetical protein